MITFFYSFVNRKENYAKKSLTKAKKRGIIEERKKFSARLRQTVDGKIKYAEMVEWSIAAVLKTVDGKLSGGSNPSLCAKKRDMLGHISFFVSIEF